MAPALLLPGSPAQSGSGARVLAAPLHRLAGALPVLIQQDTATRTPPRARTDAR